ncbi:lipopolysaccharide export system protein LptA [Chitinivorax tropicus]|uniref:Lipopolysaccharide export system protein LptA n=1 Tax=Chitinivorax tropicus TaxID=714531 RepID=A0A840MPU0_9PROT|nr:lipopolysaccharide transport periplasmic protein LptA [Chitinivorax tropicus]MBB5019465.1 lipopolysaccharide export system protein LptA [Chitinivorax tropicus]
MSNRLPNYIACCLALAFAGMAHAERADRSKPINVEADSWFGEEKTKVSTYEGNVVITQGTLLMRADKAVIRQDAEGNYHAIANGRPLTYREKRDEADDFIEGQADRMEYNGKLGQLQLFGKAKLKRGNDEVRGDYIFYDQLVGTFKVGPEAGAKTTTPGRVRMVLQPAQKDSKEAPKPADSTPPTALKPSSSISKPREE